MFFNCWSNGPILTCCNPGRYDALKKYIYQLEKQQSGRDLSLSRDLESNERSALLNEADATETDGMFIPLLDRELRKIVTFYEQQSKELLDDLEDLEKDVLLQDEIGLQGGEHYDDYDDYDEDDNDNDSISNSRSPDGRRTSTSRQRKLSVAGRRRAPLGMNSHRSELIFIANMSQRDRALPQRYNVDKACLHWKTWRIVICLCDMQKGRRELSPNLPTNLKTASCHLPRRQIILSGRLERTTLTIPDCFTNGASPIYTYPSLISSHTSRLTTLASAKSSKSAHICSFFSMTHIYLSLRYDKVTYSELKDRYLHTVVEVSQPFTQASKDKINDALNRLLELYTKCVARGDKATARQQLRLHQRENIAWERDTVWRQMIGRERRGEGAAEDAARATLLHEPEAAIVDISTPVGMFKITKRKIFKLLAVTVFAIMLNVQVVDGLEANRCLAILSLCTVLWATEVCIFSWILCVITDR